MWDPTRRYSTAFYLAMLIIVFSVAVAVSPSSMYLVSSFFVLTSHMMLGSECGSSDSDVADPDSSWVLVHYLIYPICQEGSDCILATHAML